MLPVLPLRGKAIAPFLTIADKSQRYMSTGVKLAVMRKSVKKRVDKAIAAAQHLRLGVITNLNVLLPHPDWR